MQVNAVNPISPAREDEFRETARRLGAEHGTARLTPFVAEDRPAGDYARSVTGYTGYLLHEDGVLVLLAALGVPVPETDEGPWFDACWRIAHAYTEPTTRPATLAVMRIGKPRAGARDDDDSAA